MLVHRNACQMRAWLSQGSASGHSLRMARVPIGRGRNPYFRHGDAVYPFLYMGLVGCLTSMRLVPGWLILLLLLPLYVGGVQLVIVKGGKLLSASLRMIP